MSNLRAIFTCKTNDLDDASFGGQPVEIKVTDRRQMTAEEYDNFIRSMMDDRDWLAGRGGQLGSKTLVIEVTAPDRKTLYIDPEGSSYARCVGIAW